MELRQLYYVLEIAKQGSYSKAANTLYITQSNISQQVAALESEIGTQLFIRNTHGVRLTPDGMRFCEYAKDTINAFERLKAEFIHNPSTENIVLDIAVYDFFEKSGYTDILTSFFKDHPEVVGGIRMLDAYGAYKGMDDLSIDFSIIKLFGDEKKRNRFHYLHLRTEELLVLISSENPLAAQEYVTLDEICHLPIITGNPNSFLSTGMKRLFTENKLPFQLKFMSDNPNIIQDYISADKAITLASTSSSSKFGSDKIAAVPIMPHISSNIYLTYLQKRSLTLLDQDLINHIVKKFHMLP